MLFKRRSLLLCVLALTCAATPAAHPALQQSAAPLSADTLSSYQTGQANERLRQDTDQPAICGIVLERPQCLADLRLVQAAHGADSSDAALTAWLTNGDLADKVTNWNVSSYSPSSALAKNPSFAWWWDMGIINEAAWLPVNPGTTTFFSSNIANIKSHVAMAPAQFDRSVLRIVEPVDAVRRLQASLSALQPSVSSPSVTFATGVLGDMQLGAAYATVSQMIDNPFVLARPETRLFVNQMADALDAAHAAMSDGISTASARAAFNSDIPSDPSELNAKLRSNWTAIAPQKSWPDTRKSAFLVGMFVSLMAYDAAFSKRLDIDNAARKYIALSLRRVPDAPSTLRAVITKASNNDSLDWKSVGADATAAELAIMQPQP